MSEPFSVRNLQPLPPLPTHMSNTLPDRLNGESRHIGLNSETGEKNEKRESSDASRTNEAPTQAGNATPSSPAQSQATRLIALTVQSGIELWHTPDQVPWATVTVGHHLENHPIKSMSFRRWLARLYHEAALGAAGSQAVQDALVVLSGKAMFDGPEYAVFVRLAEDEGALYLDLGGAERRAVKITSSGWQVVVSHHVPVKFVRPRGMLALPEPKSGGSLSRLRQFLNLSHDDDWTLLLAFLVGVFNPAGPYAILALSGEQGSSKSTLARFLKLLVDPNTAPLRSEPRDPRDLVIAANNSWLLAFDNFSHVSNWLSDALCRLSTGGGFSTRELYTDNEEILFDAQRPVVLTSIEDVVVRGDLLDRAIVLTLQAISDDKRKLESQLRADFEEERPHLLGALLDAVSAAKRNLDNVELGSLPRMADFALWVVAAESALGLKSGQFIKAYYGNRADAITLAFEATPVATAVQQFIATTPDHWWQGKASELLETLNEQAGFHDKHRAPDGWPKRADKLSGALKRLAPNLRRVGIEISFARSGNQGRTITIREVPQTGVTGGTGDTSTSAPGQTSDANMQVGDATFHVSDATSGASDASDASALGLSNE